MEKEDKELTQECQETIAMLERLKEKLKNLSPTGISLPLEKTKKISKSNKLDDSQTQPTKPKNKL